MRMRALAAAIAGALAVAAPASASAAEAKPASAPLRIALDRLRAAGIAPALAAVVEERVCAALAEVSHAEVVCPSDVEAAAALAKTAMAFGECQSDECLRRVDALRSADRRVTGAVERGEKGIVLSLQLAGPEGAAGARVVDKLPEDVDALVAEIPAVVQKLFP